MIEELNGFNFFAYFMNVLMINGSPNKDGCTYTALSEVAEQLEKQNIQTQIYHIGKKAIRGCVSCDECWKNSGYCAYKDDGVNECIDLLQKFDALIIGSPVYYASPNGSLLSFLDRMFYAGGAKFAYKPGAAIVSCRRGGAATAFDVLNKYFTISQMPVVSSQYWNAVHGNTPKDVKQDDEGLQIMRVLGRNMAWLLQCIHVAKETVTFPEKEKTRQWTNFIR